MRPGFLPIAQFFALCTVCSVAASWCAQQPAQPKPEDTEVWQPVPKIVTPGATDAAPPSDAIVLFNGKNEDEWVSAQDHTPARWFVHHGVLTVNKAPDVGNIETRRRFKDYQLHIEWKIPEDITGSGQSRGNSGVFLASTGPGDAGYELQVLDSYNNSTYVNGQAGSIYKQSAPLVNPDRPPGRWQTYDVIWIAPRFNPDGSLQTPALSPFSSTAFWCRTISRSRGRRFTSASRSTRRTTLRPSSCRRTATRARPSASETSG